MNAPSSFTQYTTSWLWFAYDAPKGKPIPATGLFVLFAAAGAEDSDAERPSASTRARMELGFVDGDGVLRGVGYGVRNPWALTVTKEGASQSEQKIGNNLFLFAPAVPFSATTYFICYVAHPSPDFALTLRDRARDPSDTEPEGWPFKRIVIKDLAAKEKHRRLTPPEDAKSYIPAGAERYDGWVLYRRMPYGHLPAVKTAVKKLAYDLGVVRYPAGCHDGPPNAPYPADETSHTGTFDVAVAAALHKFHDDEAAGRFFIVNEGNGPKPARASDPTPAESAPKDNKKKANGLPPEASPEEVKASWSYLFGNDKGFKSEDEELDAAAKATAASAPEDWATRDSRAKEKARRKKKLDETLPQKFRKERDKGLAEDGVSKHDPIVKEEQPLLKEYALWRIGEISLDDPNAWDERFDEVEQWSVTLADQIKGRNKDWKPWVPDKDGVRRYKVIRDELSYEQAYRSRRHTELLEAEGVTDTKKRDDTVSSELNARRKRLAEELSKLPPPDPNFKPEASKGAAQPSEDPKIGEWLSRHQELLGKHVVQDDAEFQARLDKRVAATESSASNGQAPQEPELSESTEEPQPVDDGSRTPGVADARTAEVLQQWANDRKCKRPPFLVRHKRFWAQPKMWWRFWALQEVCKTLGAQYSPGVGSTFRALGVAGGQGRVGLSYHKLGVALDVDAYYPDPPKDAPYALEARYPIANKGEKSSNAPKWIINVHSTLEPSQWPSNDDWQECRSRLVERMSEPMGLTRADETNFPPAATRFLSWFDGVVDELKNKKKEDRLEYFQSEVRIFQPQPGNKDGGTLSKPKRASADRKGANSWLNVSLVAFDLKIGLLGAHNDFADLNVGATMLWRSSGSSETGLAIQLDTLANAIDLAKERSEQVFVIKPGSSSEDPVPLEDFDLDAIREWGHRRGDPDAHLPLQAGMKYSQLDLVIDVLFEEKSGRNKQIEFLQSRPNNRVRVVDIGDGILSTTLKPGMVRSCDEMASLLNGVKPGGSANRQLVLRPVLFLEKSSLHDANPSELMFRVPQTPDPLKLEWWHNEIVGKGHFWGDCAALLGWSKDVLFSSPAPDPTADTRVWVGGAGLVERAHGDFGPSAPPARSKTEDHPSA